MVQVKKELVTRGSSDPDQKLGMMRTHNPIKLNY